MRAQKYVIMKMSLGRFLGKVSKTFTR